MNLKGVPRFRCPSCGYLFNVWSGSKKTPKRNPKIKQVEKWLLKARCPKCGILINAHKIDTRGLRENIC